MKTLIEERITDLKEQRDDILKQLCTRATNNNLTSDIVISEGRTLKQLDNRLIELQLILHQSKNFYGSKTPNNKKDGSEQ
jgi:hypothetical protein